MSVVEIGQTEVLQRTSPACRGTKILRSVTYLALAAVLALPNVARARASASAMGAGFPDEMQGAQQEQEESVQDKQDQEQEKRDREQEKRDREQEKRDHEQEVRDREQ